MAALGRSVPSPSCAHSPRLPQERPKPRVPVLHFRAARPPFVICVKLVSIGRGVGHDDRVTVTSPSREVVDTWLRSSTLS